MKSNRPKRRLVLAVAASLLAGSASAQATDDAATSTLHLDPARNHPFCEILLISGTKPDIKAQVFNTSAASLCPPDKFDALDAEQLAQEIGVEAVFKNARRHWMMDQMWLYNTGSEVSFGGVAANWMATLPIGGALAGLGKADNFPKYAPAKIQRQSKYHYDKGSEVYLIVPTDGTTWVMQTWTDHVDSTMNEAALPALGERLKNLPEGWKFMVKTLDEDLTIAPPADKDHMAHVMSDELDNVYEGCGLDTACNYIP